MPLRAVSICADFLTLPQSAPPGFLAVYPSTRLTNGGALIEPGPSGSPGGEGLRPDPSRFPPLITQIYRSALLLFRRVLVFPARRPILHLWHRINLLIL